MNHILIFLLRLLSPPLIGIADGAVQDLYHPPRQTRSSRTHTFERAEVAALRVEGECDRAITVVSGRQRPE